MSDVGLIEVTFNTLPGMDLRLIKGVQLRLNQGAAALSQKAQELTSASTYPPASAPGTPPATRTGDLTNSIHPEPNSAPLEALVIAEAEHAVFLEYGTVHMAARPFMQPAVDELTPEIQQSIDDIIAELVGG